MRKCSKPGAACGPTRPTISLCSARARLAGLTIATGHYRNGILLAPITAKLVREWITEQRVSMDWQPFDPLRFGEAKFARGST